MPQPRKPAPGSYLLAVHLFDLDRVDPMIREFMLVKNLDARSPIRLDPDDALQVGVPFKCDTLMAACICDTLRVHDKRIGDPPTRVYLRRRGTWSLIPDEAILTKVVNGSPRLDPMLFPDSVKLVKANPPTLGRVEL